MIDGRRVYRRTGGHTYRVLISPEPGQSAWDPDISKDAVYGNFFLCLCQYGCLWLNMEEPLLLQENAGKTFLAGRK